jgi:hypothetical protein
MSVPLDRLYHYLADIVNHDLLIYRWMPHGSRKLEDLKELKDYQVLDWHTWPVMICHDQEPLSFDAWTQTEFEQHVLTFLNNTNREIFAQKFIAKHHAQYHLRGATGNMYNIHDATLLLTSDCNGHDIEQYQSAGFVPVYYWSHAVIARDWFRYAQHDHQLSPKIKKITQDFLIYNRAWTGTREYRLYFTEQIVEHGLSQHCKMSFSTHDNDRYYGQHQFANSEFQISNFELENFFPANTHSANASADYNSYDYQSTGIEVVLETMFDDSRWHLTEKTLRPIACGQPFILCATPGSLQYLHKYGFETFDGLIDESYDTVLNSQQRLRCIVNEMQRIQNLSRPARDQLYQELQLISQRNQTRFFSKEFQDFVIEELKQNFQQGMSVMAQHCTGKLPAECSELYRQVPDYDHQVKRAKQNQMNHVCFDNHQWILKD